MVAQIPLPKVLRTYRYQRCVEFCWAASISMIFGFYNHPVDQFKVVRALLGGLTCTTATPPAIYALLNANWVDDYGNSFKSTSQTFYNAFTSYSDGQANVDIVRELQGGNPLLLCTTQHAMVLTECRYLPSPMGPIVGEMGVADPWPYGGGLRSLSPPEQRLAIAGGQITILAKVIIS